MDIRDITKEQFETLILLRSLEEFIADKHETFPSLSEAIWKLEENLPDEDYKQLVTDICRLTETGYILSDGTAEIVKTIKDMEPLEAVEKIPIPEVEGITPKGQTEIEKLEKMLKESPDKDKVLDGYISDQHGIKTKILKDFSTNVANITSIINSVITIIAILMGGSK
nr:hypothetical protein [uncultured Acetatifactor sp.]